MGIDRRREREAVASIGSIQQFPHHSSGSIRGVSYGGGACEQCHDVSSKHLLVVEKRRGVVAKVLGLSNASYWKEAAEIRSCSVHYQQVQEKLLEMAKAQMDRMLHISLTHKLDESLQSIAVRNIDAMPQATERAFLGDTEIESIGTGMDRTSRRIANGGHRSRGTLAARYTPCTFVCLCIRRRN